MATDSNLTLDEFKKKLKDAKNKEKKCFNFSLFPFLNEPDIEVSDSINDSDEDDCCSETFPSSQKKTFQKKKKYSFSQALKLDNNNNNNYESLIVPKSHEPKPRNPHLQDKLKNRIQFLRTQEDLNGVSPHNNNQLNQNKSSYSYADINEYFGAMSLNQLNFLIKFLEVNKDKIPFPKD